MKGFHKCLETKYILFVLDVAQESRLLISLFKACIPLLQAGLSPESEVKSLFMDDMGEVQAGKLCWKSLPRITSPPKRVHGLLLVPGDTVGDANIDFGESPYRKRKQVKERW